MSLIFDTHAHYDDSAFDTDREELLKLLPQRDIFAVINVGADLDSSAKSVQFAKKYSYIYAGIGVHPQNVNETLKDNFISGLEALLENKKVVGIGEIGLDYHYNSENKDTQKQVFEDQIKLAMKHNLPVMVHDWDAHGDTLEIIKKYRPNGVVHCFSGSVEMAKEVVKLGMSIGIGGVLTFKNAKALPEVARAIPLESILLETDAPYLAPVPFRGKRCDSSFIKFTAEKLAEMKGISTEKVLITTKNNAMRLFKVGEIV